MVCTDTPRVLLMRTRDWRPVRALLAEADAFHTVAAAWHRDGAYVYVSALAGRVRAIHTSVTASKCGCSWRSRPLACAWMDGARRSHKCGRGAAWAQTRTLPTPQHRATTPTRRSWSSTSGPAALSRSCMRTAAALCATSFMMRPATLSTHARSTGAFVCLSRPRHLSLSSLEVP
eukprot:356754-Chlamydomonas_euryale.AAC.3